MRRRSGFTVIIVLVVVGLAGCGGGSTPSTAALVATLTTDPGFQQAHMDRDQFLCVARIIEAHGAPASIADYEAHRVEVGEIRGTLTGDTLGQEEHCELPGAGVPAG